jgi:hypothetical protein
MLSDPQKNSLRDSGGSYRERPRARQETKTLLDRIR